MTLRAGALGLVLVCALTGCSGDSGGEPQSLPPVTPGPTTLAPSPTTSPSAYPQTPQGAADFARFVYAEIDRAYQTRDPEVIRPLFADACAACKNFVTSLERIRERGLTVDGRAARVVSAESPGSELPQVVTVQLDYGGIRFLDPLGQVVAEEPAGEFQDEMTLERAEASWLVTSINRVSP